MTNVECNKCQESWSGGRLPVTWYPESFAQNIPMTDMRMRPDPAAGYPGRTYRFYTGETVYPFGYGLSYTKYHYELVRAPKLVLVPLQEGHSCRNTSCLSVSLAEIQCQNTAFSIHLRVQNTGSIAGSHTVLLFTTPPAVHGAPQKHLIGFEKVWLPGNGKGLVKFSVDLCRDLSVVDEAGNRKVALGAHTLHVGHLKHSLNVGIHKGRKIDGGCHPILNSSGLTSVI